jgi:hypothetical protein
LSVNPAEVDSLLAPVRKLRASFGIDARRIDAAGCLLAGDAPRTLDELVSATGTPRRTVEALLRAAGELLESDGDRFRFSPVAAAAAAAEFGCGQPALPPDPWQILASADPELVTEAAGLVARAPRPVQELDQVSATPLTVLKRGHYLRQSFDLREAHVLFVGDHDLTSLGLFLAGGAPGLRASVVDVAEPLLEFIGAEARRRGYDIRCYYADLRLGLPETLQGTADAVFTDPPYTPQGMRLFVARGLQGMGEQRTGRILAAYGYGEQAALGLSVQEALAPLHLAYEAVLPGFNRYDGAQAIGSAAALYVLCPTRRSQSAAQAAVADTTKRLYTHGGQALEAGTPELSDAAAARVIELAGGPGSRPLLVGDGWPAAYPQARLSLPRLLAEPLPRNLRNHTTAVVNLYPAFGSSLLRVLLAANLARVAVVARNGLPEFRDEKGQRALAELIGPKYRVTRLLRSTPERDTALLLAERSPDTALGDPQQVAAAVYSRAHGKVGNAWREALITWSSARGTALSKNEARQVIDDAVTDPVILGYCPLDLPRHLFPVLLDCIARSVDTVRG